MATTTEKKYHHHQTQEIPQAPFLPRGESLLTLPGHAGLLVAPLDDAGDELLPPRQALGAPDALLLGVEGVEAGLAVGNVHRGLLAADEDVDVGPAEEGGRVEGADPEEFEERARTVVVAPDRGHAGGASRDELGLARLGRHREQDGRGDSSTDLLVVGGLVGTVVAVGRVVVVWTGLPGRPVVEDGRGECD